MLLYWFINFREIDCSVGLQAAFLSNVVPAGTFKEELLFACCKVVRMGAWPAKGIIAIRAATEIIKMERAVISEFVLFIQSPTNKALVIMIINIEVIRMIVTPYYKNYYGKRYKIHDSWCFQSIS